jgi:hypothetical protein
MEVPEVHVLNRVGWQFFGTLTFKSERLPERVRLGLYFALLRESKTVLGTKFAYLLWCLRQERGEMGGRRHFHFLLAGTQERTVIPTSCFWLQAKWEQLGGGMARIRVFDTRLNAGSYMLSRSGFDENIGADVYESAKFSDKACELMLADRVWKVAGWRSGYETARLARTQ